MSCKCSICKRSFCDIARLKMHMDSQHLCSVCGKNYKNGPSLTRHKRVHTGERPYECPFCLKRFADVSPFVRHKRMHTGERPYVCDLCGKAFSAPFTLSQHLKTVHTKAKPHKCGTCGRCFAHSSHLTNHKVVHDMREGEAYFECAVCFVVFFKEDNLEVHKRLHYSDKSRALLCSKCGKKFGTKGALLTHMKVHDLICPGFKCVYGKSFVCRENLQRHLKEVHFSEKFLCSLCGCILSSRRSLAQHSKLHGSEKSHLCTLCGKGFLSSYSLKRHQTVHTGEKPYKCKICDMAFSDPSTRNKHKMRLHS